MLKILLVSHSPMLTTSYRRVIKNIADALSAAGHRLIVLGIGFHGEARGLNYPVYSVGSASIEDAIGSLIRFDEPDVLLTLGDPWMFELLHLLPERA